MSALAAAQIAQTAIGLGTGAYQWYKGNKMEKEAVRPFYEPPAEIKNYLSAAEVSSLQGLPEEQRQQYIDNVMRQVQSGMYNASSRASGLNAIGSTMAAANDANRDLLSADAGARIQNRDKLQEARRVYSDFEDKAFKINELDPYEFTMNKAQALQGAGMQNIMGGANTATQYVQQDANKKEDKEKFDYWMKMYDKV
jgi:hypothetical protein